MRFEDFIAGLEQGTLPIRDENGFPRADELRLLASIALSAKRAADALEAIAFGNVIIPVVQREP